METVYYCGSLEQWKTIDNYLTTENNGESENQWCVSYQDFFTRKNWTANIVFNPNDPAKEVTPGDLTGDGKINSRDVIVLMKLVLTPNPEITAANDINSDGKLNSRDVIALMKLVLAKH